MFVSDDSWLGLAYCVMKLCDEKDSESAPEINNDS